VPREGTGRPAADRGRRRGRARRNGGRLVERGGRLDVVVAACDARRRRRVVGRNARGYGRRAVSIRVLGLDMEDTHPYSRNRHLLRVEALPVSGKRIVFCTFGSLGDLYPFLAIARELKRQGNTPVIATTPVYRSLVETEGLAFHPVRPDIDVNDPEILGRVMHPRTGGRYVVCDVLLPALHDSF